MKIAEIGLCHDGDFNKALELIQAAKEKGYTAVKFQKRSAGHWFNNSTPRPDSPFGKTEGEHRHKLEFTPGMHEILQKQAHSAGMVYGCSVWDPISAYEIYSILEGDDFIKIGRPKNCDVGILQTVSNLSKQKHLPVIISCRTKIEAQFVKDIYFKKTLFFKPDLKILFCPGNYPDRQKDLPEELHAWADGTSFHHDDPSFGAYPNAEIVERHVALKSTLHRDKAWGLILDE